MTQQPSGNGSGKFNVLREDMGGWVRVFTRELALVPDELGVYLSHALTEWFRQRPQLTMRCVVPLIRDGYTAELHAWYTLHVFPDVSGQAPEPQT